jgi:hypothetical protein
MGRDYAGDLRRQGIDPKEHQRWYESQRVQEVKELWRRLSTDGKATFMAWAGLRDDDRLDPPGRPADHA